MYPSYFLPLSASEVVQGFVKGVQFDSATTMLFLSPVLVLLSLPLSWIQKSTVRIMLSCVAGFILLGMLIYCLSDLAYFGEVQRHIGSEVLNISADKAALVEIAFSSRLEHTIYAFVFLTMLALLWYVIIIRPLKKSINLSSSWVIKIFAWLGLALLYFILFRGFILTSRPINLSDAFSGSKLQQANLSLNPVYMSYREIKNRLNQKPLNYVSSQELQSFAKNNPLVFQWHHPLNQPTKKNLVLILLESWSYKYIDGLSGSQHKVTPFMDSLISKSQVWDNYYAAGQRSIIGIQAILSSLPALPNQPTLGFGLELKQMSKIADIANQYDYRTIMMQSSARRSFHMDSIANALGFQEYYGKEDVPLLREYPQEQPRFGWDYDALQFFSQVINKKNQQPFFAFMFTGTTHEPFPNIGKEFELYPHDAKNEYGFLNTLKYSDWALEQFMKEAEKQEWYKNTIFIFTADHTLNAESDESLPEKFHIPLVIYTPDGSLTPKREQRLASQYDLFPSIMDLLGFNQPIYTYGKSLFSEEHNEQIMLNQGDVMGMVTSRNWLGFTEQGIQIKAKALTAEDNQSYENLKLKMQFADQLLRENRWDKSH
ncbi:LTA synthase family protein [Glaesserella australis]|nr:LTA synthase family protein [Glaesserella australis]